MVTELMCGSHFYSQRVDLNSIYNMVHGNDAVGLSKLIEPKLGRLSKRILSAIRSGVTPIIFMENAEGDVRTSELIFNSEQRPVTALEDNKLGMWELRSFDRLQVAMMERAYIEGESRQIKPRILVESGDGVSHNDFDTSFSTAWDLVQSGQLNSRVFRSREDLFQTLYSSMNETLHDRNSRLIDQIKRIPLSGDKYKVFGFIGSAHASIKLKNPYKDLRIGFEDGSKEGYLNPLAAVSLLGLSEGVQTLNSEYLNAMVLAMGTVGVQEDDFSRRNKISKDFYSKYGESSPVIGRAINAGFHKVRSNW